MKKDNHKAENAVIGVILMVAITVAIAATIYFYVTEVDPGNRYDTETVEFSGILRGFGDYDNKAFIMIGNDTIDNLRVSNSHENEYLIQLLGKDITIVFEKREGTRSDTTYYYYQYAYINALK